MSIRLIWISGHSDVRGNEQAERLAKEAAEGRASGQAKLLAILWKLPTGVSACKREYLEKMKSRWLSEWRESPRKRRLDLIDPSFSFNSFRRRLEKMSRGHASLLVQVRSEHLPLNFYLHRIGKAGSKYCPECKEGPVGESIVESINHFLYDCEAFSEQRRRLFRAVGSRNTSVRDLMLEEKRMKALAIYIITTKRISEG